jgi:hypothetical protein
MAPGGASGVDAVGDLVNSWEMVGAANVNKGMRTMGSSRPAAARAMMFRRELGIVSSGFEVNEGGGGSVMGRKDVEGRCCRPSFEG